MKFSDLQKTFVIAEIGGNHEGSIEYAKKTFTQCSSDWC